MWSPWLASVGFSMMFSALFSKTYRVNRLFGRPYAKRVTVMATDVMAPMLVLMSMNVSILMVWTIVSPLTWKREIVSYDEFEQATESRGYCTSDGFLPFIIVLVILNVGAMGFASYQSYLARKISTEFQESDHIGRAVLSMTLVSFVGVPTMILVSDDPPARYFVTVSIIFVLCAVVLISIFVPKVIYVRKQKRKGMDTKRAVQQSYKRTYETSSQQFKAPVNEASVFNSITMNNTSNDQTSWGDRNGAEETMRLRLENEQLRKRNSELMKALNVSEQPESISDDQSVESMQQEHDSLG